MNLYDEEEDKVSVSDEEEDRTSVSDEEGDAQVEDDNYNEENYDDENTHSADDDDDDEKDEFDITSNASGISSWNKKTPGLDFDYPDSARFSDFERNKRKKKQNLKKNPSQAEKSKVPAWQTLMQLPRRLAMQKDTKRLTASQIGLSFGAPKNNQQKSILSKDSRSSVKNKRKKIVGNRPHLNIDIYASGTSQRSMSPHSMASLLVARSMSPLVDWQTPFDEDNSHNLSTGLINKGLKEKKNRFIENNSSEKQRGILEEIMEVDHSNKSQSNQEDDIESIRNKFSLGLSLKMALWLATTRRRLRNRYENARQYITELAKKKGIRTHTLKESPKLSDDEESDDEELPYYQQGNLQMYSNDNIRKRLSLKREQRIIGVINEWWNATVKIKNKSNCISKRIYTSLFMAVYTVMMPTGAGKTLEDARKSAEDDWIQIGLGSSTRQMRYETFFDSIFQLADIWCETIELDEYVLFLTSLFDAVYVDATLPLIMSLHIDRNYIKQLLLRSSGVSIREENESPLKRKKSKLDSSHKITQKKDPWRVKSGPNIQKASATSSSSKVTSNSEISASTDNSSAIDVSINQDESSFNNKSSSTLDYHSQQIDDQNEKNKNGYENYGQKKQERQQELPIKQKRILQNQSVQDDEETQRIVEELRKKENDRKMHRALLELINQNDDFVLERTIFNRMVANIRNESSHLSSSPMQVGGELVSMMQNGVISSTHQTYMRRKDKLNLLELMQTFLKLKAKKLPDEAHSQVIVHSISRNNNSCQAVSSETKGTTESSFPVKKSVEEQIATSLVSQETWEKLLEISNSLLNDDKIEDLQHEFMQERTHDPNLVKLTTQGASEDRKSQEAAPLHKRDFRVEERRLDRVGSKDLIVYEIARKSSISESGVKSTDKDTSKDDNLEPEKTRIMPSEENNKPEKKILHPVSDPIQLDIPTRIDLPKFVRDIAKKTPTLPVLFEQDESALEYRDEIEECATTHRSTVSTDTVEIDKIFKKIVEPETTGSTSSVLSSWWNEEYNHTSKHSSPQPQEETVSPEKETFPSDHLSSARTNASISSSSFIDSMAGSLPTTARSKDREYEFRASREKVVNNNPFYVAVRDEQAAIAEKIYERRQQQQRKWERLYGHKKGVLRDYSASLDVSTFKQAKNDICPSISYTRKSWYVEPTIVPSALARNNKIDTMSLDQSKSAQVQSLEIIAVKDDVRKECMSVQAAQELTISEQESITSHVSKTTTMQQPLKIFSSDTMMLPDSLPVKNRFSDFPVKDQEHTMLVPKRPFTASGGTTEYVRMSINKHEKEITKKSKSVHEELIEPLSENLAGIRQLLQNKKKRITSPSRITSVSRCPKFDHHN